MPGLRLITLPAPSLPAVFDKTKLSWMNGQHLRSLPEEAMKEMVGGRWAASGLLHRAESPFVAAALGIVQNSLELVAGEQGAAGLPAVHPRTWWSPGMAASLSLAEPCMQLDVGRASARAAASPRPPSRLGADADRELRALLGYPLGDTLGSDAAKSVVEDNFQQVGWLAGQLTWCLPGRRGCCQARPGRLCRTAAAAWHWASSKPSTPMGSAGFMCLAASPPVAPSVQIAQAVLDAYDSGDLATALASGHDGYKVRMAVRQLQHPQAPAYTAVALVRHLALPGCLLSSAPRGAPAAGALLRPLPRQFATYACLVVVSLRCCCCRSG